MGNVSRSTLARADGSVPCVRCGRPVERMRTGTGGHGARGRYQSYCNACHAEYNRDRRRGKTGVLVRQEDRGLVLAIQRAELTAQEREFVIDAIVEMRAEPSGRHHARLVAAGAVAGNGVRK